jgi:hypothetical protein
VITRILCRLGIISLLVLLLAWLTLLPITLCFPHTAQLAILFISFTHCIKKVYYDNILKLMLQELLGKLITERDKGRK